jgi:hypothetical protein
MSDFNSLTKAFEDHFDSDWDHLPDLLKQRWNDQVLFLARHDVLTRPLGDKLAILPSWDALSARQRREVANQRDQHRDPSKAHLHREMFDKNLKIIKLEKLSDKALTDDTPSLEMESQDRQLRQLRQEVDALSTDVSTLPVETADRETDAPTTRPPHKAKKRGPAPVKRQAVEKQMRADIAAGKFTMSQLYDMTEISMAAEYKASRETVRVARDAIMHANSAA